MLLHWRAAMPLKAGRFGCLAHKKISASPKKSTPFQTACASIYAAKPAYPKPDLLACADTVVCNDSGLMHLAAALGRRSALLQLVAQGASPEARAADGQAPLGVALASGRRDLADWLDWRGWRLPRRALQASDVPAAAIVGDADAVRRLLDLGLPVDAVDSQGCSALLRAAGGGHRALVDLLLARGANPALAANTGATPLSAAVSMRQLEIVERLLDAGAGLEQRLPGDVTVLMLAAALGLPELAARLLAAGADLHAHDAQGLTPLHCATLYGFTARDRTRLVALLDTLLQGLKLLEWDSLGGSGSRGYGKVAFTAITRNGKDISSCFAAIQPFAK